MNKELRGKRLMILGGMRISCEIVRKAKTMGVYTIVADYNKIENSPGKQIADETADLSVIDVDAVVEYIREHAIDGVFVGFNDMLLPYYAEICEKAGLPCYGTKEQFEILTNKNKYKALCRQFEVPTIKEYDINSQQIEFPVLVKPADSSGSRGITICKSPDDLEKAKSKALSASKSGEILVERYMDCREATVFWIFQNGHYYLSAIGNRHVKQNQGNDIIPLPVGYTFPSALIPQYRQEVEENCKKMFRHLDIRNGMMFMQCKVENGTCYVYDLGYRLTGSLEYKLLEKNCGYDPLEMMIIFALTGKMGNTDIAIKVMPEFKNPCFNVSCLSAPGTIKEIKGLQKIRGFKEVVDVVTAYEAGETITTDMKGHLAQITVRVLGAVDECSELLPVMEKIWKTIQILDTNGKNLLLPGLEYSDIDGCMLNEGL